METTVRIHHGSYESIPSNASPGLLFLKMFLPILDSLDEFPPIHHYVSPDARFVINGEAPLSLAKVSEMFGMRRKAVQKFKHDVSVAWEIQREKGYSVIFEGTSATQFRSDDVECQVAEMNVWELETSGYGEELKLVEARCWMDPSAVRDRSKVVVSNV